MTLGRIVFGAGGGHRKSCLKKPTQPLIFTPQPGRPNHLRQVKIMMTSLRDRQVKP